jgi:rubredoxin
VLDHEEAMEEKRRKLVWFASENFQGWACSACAWAFNPSGPPVGKTLDAMMVQFEQQRDKEFASHVCAEHPRTPKNPR